MRWRCRTHPPGDAASREQNDPRYADAYLALGRLPYTRRPSLVKEEIRHAVPKDWQPIVEEADRFYKRAFRTDPMVGLQVMSLVNDMDEPQVRAAMRAAASRPSGASGDASSGRARGRIVVASRWYPRARTPPAP